MKRNIGFQPSNVSGAVASFSNHPTTSNLQICDNHTRPHNPFLPVGVLMNSRAGGLCITNGASFVTDSGYNVSDHAQRTPITALPSMIQDLSLRDKYSTCFPENHVIPDKNSFASVQKGHIRRNKHTGNIGTIKQFSESSSRKYNCRYIAPLDDFIINTTKVNCDLPASSSFSSKSPGKTLCKIGKVRETPKPKHPTSLKKIILHERRVRSKSTPPSSKSGLMDANNLGRSGSPMLPSLSLKYLFSSKRELMERQNELVCDLLTKLAHYTDQAYVTYARSPFHRKRNRRLVCGFREVIKHLKLNSVRIILVASDLEGKAMLKFQLKQMRRGADSSPASILVDKLQQIWDLANRCETVPPILVTHKRHQLAGLVHKPGSVSVIGIINVDGAHELETQLLALKSGINLPTNQTWMTAGTCFDAVRRLSAPES